MICGKPLFPGTSTINQLEKIVELSPMPEGMALNEVKKLPRTFP